MSLYFPLFWGLGADHSRRGGGVGRVGGEGSGGDSAALVAGIKSGKARPDPSDMLIDFKII